MIAHALALQPKDRSSQGLDPSLWPARFLQKLPTIRRIVRYRFRRLRADSREEAMQEVIANCFVAYSRLVARGREGLAFPTPLARFAIAQYRAGRRVGNRLNKHDLTSPCLNRKRRDSVLSLFQCAECGHWQELVVQDKRSTPAEVATIRIDFQQWLSTLSRAKRQTAELLAGGAGTGEAAAQLGLTASRVSQLRQELKDDWARFQGEPTVLC